MIMQGTKMDKTFTISTELPLKYHGTFALVAVRERKSVNELIAEILINDPRIIVMQERIDSLPEFESKRRL